MLSFADIQQVRELHPVLYSPLGTVYVTPSTRLPLRAVRHFDKELAPAMIPAYVDLIHAVGEWAALRPAVRRWVRVNRPIEVASDYVVRDWDRYYYSLRSYDEPDEESPVPVPGELPLMREAVQAALHPPQSEQERILTEIIRRSLLGPSGKTVLDNFDGPFLIVEPKLTVDDVLGWKQR